VVEGAAMAAGRVRSALQTIAGLCSCFLAGKHHTHNYSLGSTSSVQGEGTVYGRVLVLLCVYVCVCVCVCVFDVKTME
jgi:hypothetical protein